MARQMTKHEQKLMTDQMYDYAILHDKNWKSVKAKAKFKRPIDDGYFTKGVEKCNELHQKS